MSNRRPFFIDTDTASDDAVALVIALRHPDIDVVGIGVVAGNVPLEQGVQNALYTRDLCGRDDVPVYGGSYRPIVLPLSTAQHVHGQDGMGDIGLHLRDREPHPSHAVDALIAASHRHAGELTVVTLGPLTNLALAVHDDPLLVNRLRRVVVMGAAADHVGNMNPVAEYNMWADPHAVDLVLAAGLPIEFVGWDISRHFAVIEPTLADELRALSALGEFCVVINKVVAEFCATDTKLAGFDLPDPIAMAYAIDPAIATETRRLHLAVETESELTRGMVVMDLLGLTENEPNALVVTAADRERFLSMLFDAVR
jgi:purine nucleosidase